MPKVLLCYLDLEVALIFIFSIFSLVASFQIAAAQSCNQTVEKLQKKLLVDHVSKYPLTYGEEIEIVRINTCSGMHQNLKIQSIG